MNHFDYDVTLLVGIPASGKSTWVANNAGGSRVICPDQIREELTGDMSDQTKNKEVFDLAFYRFEDYLIEGSKVIVDATNCHAKARRRWLNIAKSLGKTVCCVVLKVDKEICIERNQKRSRVVPVDVIDRMFSLWQDPTKEEGFLEIFEVKQ